MKYIFTFLILLSATALFPQAVKVTVTNLKPLHADNKFPSVNTPEKPFIAEKINTYLQLSYLEIVPGAFKKHPFEKVTYNSNASTNYSEFIDWKRLRSRSNILTLEIDGESTGAYSEGFTNYENFDLQTGDKILISQLLSKTGTKNLEQILNRLIRKEISEYVFSLDSTKKKKGPDENLDEQLDMYNECLDGIENNNMGYYSFSLGKDSITFIRARCSNHALRALDDLDTFYESFSYKQIEKYLSPTGKKILFGSADAKSIESPEGKIFKGLLAKKYPVTVLIDYINSDGSLTMKYWYDKYKQPIEWSGTFKSGEFHLTEYAGNSLSAEAISIKAKIRLIWTDNKRLVGTWTDSQTGRVSPIELNVY